MIVYNADECLEAYAAHLGYSSASEMLEDPEWRAHHLYYEDEVAGVCMECLSIGTVRIPEEEDEGGRCPECFSRSVAPVHYLAGTV